MNQVVVDKVTTRIIQALEDGVVPWQKTWKGQQSAPQNFISRKPYRGANAMLLSFIPKSTPYFVTYKQATSLGGHVKKGSEGIPIIFTSPITRKGSDGDEFVLYWMQRYYTVFRLEDTTLELPPAPEDNLSFPEFDSIYENYEDAPSLLHGGDRAFYVPSKDSVTMPHRVDFKSPEHYYSVLYHELAHSTGHVRRLDRKGIREGTFGDETYSMEELVAEISATFLNSLVGIDSEEVFQNSAAYLANWLKVLKENRSMILVAASQAQKAVDLLVKNTEYDEE